MPDNNLPDLVLARSEEEWKKCFVAIVYALTNGDIGKVARWQAQLKIVIQSYADLYKDGKIAKPYAPDKPQDALLARQELLEGYQAIDKFEKWLAKQNEETDNEKS